MSRKGGAAKFGDPILGNVLKGLQADATRVAEQRTQAVELLRGELARLLPRAQVSVGEPFNEWADRMRYEARQRAIAAGDEFHKGPYPTDFATVTTSRRDYFPSILRSTTSGR